VRLPWTARTRRLLFVVAVLLVLTFPLAATLVTRARVERSGVDVVASVVEAAHEGDSYLLAFRFPEGIDPDQRRYSAEVGRATYEKAAESKQVTVRVLEGRPRAHRVEGEIEGKSQYVVVGVADALVLAVGLWWVKVGRRRPAVRMQAVGPLEPAGDDETGSLGRAPGEDVYEVVGHVVSADDTEVVLDVGERRVVVVLAGHANPVDVGSPARARGPMIG
jgi:hypothetical protein